MARVFFDSAPRVIFTNLCTHTDNQGNQKSAVLLASCQEPRHGTTEGPARGVRCPQLSMQAKLQALLLHAAKRPTHGSELCVS